MRRLRSVLVFLLALLLGGLALNCSSGGTIPFPGATGGGGGTVAPGRAAVEGFVFAAPGGGGPLAFGNTATPPAGLAPVAGAAVDSGFGATATTDARGFFRLDDLEPGQYRLRVRPAGGAETLLSVTLFDGAAVRVGATAVTRDAAADQVRARLAASGAAAGSYALYAPRQPLPAGTRVAPALGNERAEQDPALEYRPPADAWLFYADLNPAARFQHRVRYYFVDAASGQVTEREVTSWPAINGRFYYFDEPDASDDLVNAPADDLALQRAVTPPGSAGRDAVAFGPPLPPSARHASAVAMGRDHVDGCTTGKVHALLILGDPRGDFTADADQAAGLLRDTIRADRVLEYRPGPNRVNALTEIRNLYREIRNGLGPCDTLYILIATHGYPDGHVTIAQRTQTDDVVLPGGKNGKLTVAADLVSFYPYIDLDLGATAACHVIVEVHTCYSGKVIQDWQREIENDRTGRYWGKKMLLMAECAPNEVALGRAKADGPPPGGFFGVEMQRQLSALLGTPPQTAPVTVSLFTTAFDQAVPGVRQQTADRPNDATGLPGENPTRWLREPPPHERCGATSVTGVQLDRDLTVNGVAVARAGERVPLFRLEGYRESQAETPVTDEQGCATPHLHAASPNGVTLRAADGEVLGTIPDPAPRKCGYGPLVQIPIEELFP